MRARPLAVASLLLCGACASGGRPPVVVAPTPAPTPVVVPTPTPAPTPSACLPPPTLGKFEAKNVGQFRVVIDATPKTCANAQGGDLAWNKRCSTGQQCSPGGVEGLDPSQREAAEAKWGPYLWEIQDAHGKWGDCVISGECQLDRLNPLRVIAPGAEGKAIRITGGNGVAIVLVGARIQ